MTEYDGFEFSYVDDTGERYYSCRDCECDVPEKSLGIHRLRHHGEDAFEVTY